MEKEKKGEPLSDAEKKLVTSGKKKVVTGEKMRGQRNVQKRQSNIQGEQRSPEVVGGARTNAPGSDTDWRQLLVVSTVLTVCVVAALVTDGAAVPLEIGPAGELIGLAGAGA